MHVTGEIAVVWAFGALIVGAILTTILMAARRLCAWLAALSIAVSLLFAVQGAIGIAEAGGPLEFRLFRLGFITSSLAVHFDWLSAMLALLTLTLGLLCGVYAGRYVAHVETPRVLGFWPAYLCFLAGMYGLVCVADLLFFIVMWEFMSLSGYALIVYEKERRENLRAGLKYFVMTHAANMGLFIGALILYRAVGSFDFSDLRWGLTALAEARPWLTNLAVALIALAFVTKAGLFPVGDWLPDAHPAAPSPVSAMLSGVMVKLGAYATIRLVFWVLPVAVLPGSWLVWWGIVLGAWGALSAFVGSAAAVVSNDSKRLLAYSTIGQSGYIFIAIGIALAFLRANPLISAVALIAALLHILADAAHKSLLFLTAGSVVYRTGQRDMNHLGGLMARMPSTGTAALIGTLSLAGMPLTGAFVSKWLMFQSGLFAGLDSPIFIVYVVAALFASVMAIAYGLKFFGAVFLGACPEQVARQEPREVPFSMDLPQMLLAGACVALGVLAVVPIGWCAAALPGALTGPATLALSEAGPWSIMPRLSVTGVSALFAPLWIAALFVACLLLSWGLSRLGRAPVRHVEGWVCGERVSPELTRVQAHGYFWALTDYLRGIYPQVGLPRIALPERTPPVLDIDRWGFDRIAAGCRWMAARLSALHSGVPQLYMLWQAVGAGAVIFLLWLVVRATTG